MKSVQTNAITKVVLKAMVMLPVSILLKTNSTKRLSCFFSYYYEQKTIIYLILEKRCCFITDICIKSYHNQLKSYHFSRTRNIRVNRSVIFFHELYYWLSIRCCARSIQHKKNVSREEKKKADIIDIDEQSVHSLKIDNVNCLIFMPT